MLDGTDYAVGYGKPPVHSRFKPGQSGNPKGRQKGQKSVKAILSTVLNEKVTVRSSRGSRKVTKIEALLQKLMNDALTGKPKAAEQIIRMAKDAGLDAELAAAADGVSANQLAEEDQAILDRHLGARDQR